MIIRYVYLSYMNFFFNLNLTSYYYYYYYYVNCFVKNFSINDYSFKIKCKLTFLIL